MSTLFSSLAPSSSTASLTENLGSGDSDVYDFSAVSQSLNAIASVAEEAGVSEGMDNVRRLAASMAADGVDVETILQNLDRFRDLIKNESDYFLEIFSAETTV